MEKITLTLHWRRKTTLILEKTVAQPRGSVEAFFRERSVLLSWSDQAQSMHRRGRQGTRCTSWLALEEIWAAVDSASSDCQSKGRSAGQHSSVCPSLAWEDQTFVVPRLVFLLPKFPQQLALPSPRCNWAFTGISMGEERRDGDQILPRLSHPSESNHPPEMHCSLRTELLSGGNLSLLIIKQAQGRFLIYVPGIIGD